MNEIAKQIVICGPTSCGKTGVAFKVAQKIDAEIINSDKFYLYPHKYFSVGTGFSDDLILMRKMDLKSHLYGILSPNQYRLEPNQYANYVKRLVPSILRRGKRVLIQGCSVSYNYALILTGIKAYAIHPPIGNGLLEEKIYKRVCAMFQDGLIMETENALRHNLGNSYVMRKGDIYIPTVQLLKRKLSEDSAIAQIVETILFKARGEQDRYQTIPNITWVEPEEILNLFQVPIT